MKKINFTIGENLKKNICFQNISMFQTAVSLLKLQLIAGYSVMDFRLTNKKVEF